MIFHILFWFVFSLILAGLEVEAEGKYGWAEKMPTWYRTRGFAGRAYGLIMGGKPLTGYHAWMFVMPLAAVHSAFFVGAPWSLAAEAIVFSRYFAVAILWDFLWFVINPHYGMMNFRKNKVWWHAKSVWVLGRFPIDYLVGWGISLACAGGAMLLGIPTAVKEQAILLIGLFTLTLGTIAVSPLYHRWYWAMRKRDDRENAPIFH